LSNKQISFDTRTLITLEEEWRERWNSIQCVSGVSEGCGVSVRIRCLKGIVCVNDVSLSHGVREQYAWWRKMCRLIDRQTHTHTHIQTIEANNGQYEFCTPPPQDKLTNEGRALIDHWLALIRVSVGTDNCGLFPNLSYTCRQ
jgi:hypothetical protein